MSLQQKRESARKLLEAFQELRQLRLLADPGVGAQEHTDATRRPHTRQQLVELNRSLAGRSFDSGMFRHPNSLETQLLPRLAELFTLRDTSPEAWNWPEWVRQSTLVDLDEDALKAVAEMDGAALAELIIESQQRLFDQLSVGDKR